MLWIISVISTVARAAKQPGLAAAFQRAQQVDGLDARLEDRPLHPPLRQWNRRTIWPMSVSRAFIHNGPCSTGAFVRVRVQTHANDEFSFAG
jgi:hypothetical protein